MAKTHPNAPSRSTPPEGHNAVMGADCPAKRAATKNGVRKIVQKPALAGAPKAKRNAATSNKSTPATRAKSNKPVLAVNALELRAPGAPCKNLAPRESVRPANFSPMIAP